jgi:Zn2+/Cd2+-exporting ATPase
VVAVTAVVAVLPPLGWGAPWGDAFYRAMTLLVVASPCALVISTPAAILSGIANGARHGVLFKGGAHLDLAGTIDTVAFDKTGTLTVGQPMLREVLALEASRVTAGGGAVGEADARRSLLALVAGAEAGSEHHLARAVVAAARGEGISVPRADAFEAHPGEGVTAVVAGTPLWAGNEILAKRHGAALDDELESWTVAETSLGRSVVYAGSGDRVLGGLSFGDVLKPNAAAAVRGIREQGVRWVCVLSGDHPAAVRAVTAELAVDDIRAGLLPHEKVAAVQALRERSTGVAMVGDGINDAPAMATATVGIAMGAAGTDVAIETADIVLMSDDVQRVAYAIGLGRRARRVVRQNVWFSVGWMALLVVLALTVGIPLTLAVVAHEGSTLLVAANGLRLLRGRPADTVAPAV